MITFVWFGGIFLLIPKVDRLELFTTKNATRMKWKPIHIEIEFIRVCCQLAYERAMNSLVDQNSSVF